MQTRERDVSVGPLRVVTRVLLHFLRVNAQMCNLDKQKTAQGPKTLWVSGRTDISVNKNIYADKYFHHINTPDKSSCLAD